MKGKECYDRRYKDRIKILLNKNKYKDLLNSFYYHLCSGSVESESSRYNYLRIISSFLNDINKNPKEINIDDYNYYKQSKNNCKSSYQIVIHTALKQFSEYMYLSGRTDKYYMENIKRPKSKEDIETVDKRSKNYLTIEEIKNLTQTINDGVGTKRARSFQRNWKERDTAIITLFLTTGLRCSGIYNLDINSIDFEKKTLITIEKGNKIRTIILSDTTIETLNKWIEKRNVILDPDSKEDALFISVRKNRLCQESIAAIVQKYSSNIEGKHITPHKLRATYATQVYNNVHDIELVQELMGHSNVSTTKLYIRERQNRTNVGSEIMSNIINT